jgi:hypothetical protein
MTVILAQLGRLRCGVQRESKFHIASAQMVIKVAKIQQCHEMKCQRFASESSAKLD